MPLYLRQFILFCSVWLLVGCGPTPSTEETTSDGGACPIGERGCPCFPNTSCFRGLVCEQGTCVSPTPQPEKLVEVTPEPLPEPPPEPPCQPGRAACRCSPTGSCFEGLRCQTGLCVTCTTGSAGCHCKTGNTCEGGLTCSNGLCTGCVGKEGCSCYPNKACDAGLRCEDPNNTGGTCRSCSVTDKKECSCEKDADCGGLACINRRCQDLATLQKVPQNPRCYSPCEGDIQGADGTLRVCHVAYRLTEGCGVGQTCKEGSCLSSSQELAQVPPGTYPFCADASDCPAWQTCVSGRCYSTCSSQADCAQGLKCHRYVCRRPCSLKQSSCSSNETCETQGSEEGVCAPIKTRPSNLPAQQKSAGSFSLPFTSFRFTNHSTSQEIAIYNKGDFASSFTIKRKQDNISSSNPLQWVRFDLCKTYSDDGKKCLAFENKPSAQEPFSVPSVGSGKIAIVKVSNAAGQPSDKKTYQGTLVVEGDRMGQQEVVLDYRESSDGQWTGRMIAFGNFNFDEQRDGNKFPNTQGTNPQQISNALLRQWLSFKAGAIPWDEFRAILTAVTEASWSLPKVKDDCKRIFQTNDDTLCYPFTSANGYKILTQSNREAPVPSGISELPFALNLRRKASDDKVLEGQVVTERALHYPGNAAIEITFGQIPGQQSITPITQLAAQIDLGGRYEITDKESCQDTQLFERVSIPWLLSDFTQDSYEIAGSLMCARYGCRDKRVPLTPKAGQTTEELQNDQRKNTSLSGANPIPNSRRLRRRIELLDGDLVQNRYLFILYKERFVSFFN